MFERSIKIKLICIDRQELLRVDINSVALQSDSEFRYLMGNMTGLAKRYAIQCLTLKFAKYYILLKIPGACTVIIFFSY